MIVGLRKLSNHGGICLLFSILFYAPMVSKQLCSDVYFDTLFITILFYPSRQFLLNFD